LAGRGSARRKAALLNDGVITCGFVALKSEGWPVIPLFDPKSLNDDEVIVTFHNGIVDLVSSKTYTSVDPAAH
jgi:hypothetical protein